MKQLPLTSNATSNSSELSDTFKLLKEGEENINLSERYKNITLVLGNTGAGKSTFIQWIAGDNTKLISKEEGEDTGVFIIEDGNRIGSSTINSQTIFPELVIDSKTNAAYYDCPGFSDTRSTSNDIATTYFIKKLSDYANSVKIILVVSYSSVQKGVDRQDFPKLLRHSTDFIKNIGKFQNSIAIVVAKVNNQTVRKGKHYFLVSDEKVIATIADFLQEVKQDLENKSNSKDEIFHKSAINLINVLLEKNNEGYRKIGIFRRPDESGPLSNITLLQEGKAHIEEILNERLQFTVKNNDDFGYTISERSKNDINHLVEIINDRIWYDITEVVGEVQQYCSKLVNHISDEIDSFINRTEVVLASEAEMHTYLGKVYNITSGLPFLLKEVGNLTDVEDLATKTNNCITRLGIYTCTDNIKDITDQGRYFNFLQTVSDKKLNIRPWVSLFYPMETCLYDSKKIEKYILDKAEKISYKVTKQNINHLTETEIVTYYRKEIDSLEIENLPIAVSKFKVSILDFVNFKKSLEFLKILNSGAFDTWNPAPFNDLMKHFFESEKWYKFLRNLYVKFSEYGIQANTNRYNVVNIADWGQQNRPQGIVINKNNFKQFLEKVKQYSVTDYESVKNMEITEARFKELNHMLQLTIGSQKNSVCLLSESGKVVVKGSYIKFSDFIDNHGKVEYFCRKGTKLNSVNIFALNTVFIDRNFNGVGDKLQFSIVAPKWEIVGTREINLDGIRGSAHYHSIANGGHYPSGRGWDGKPGLPGGAAGNFLGIGDEFINGRSLTVTADGGQGGPGQAGGNGADGRDGEQANVDGDFERKFIRDDKLVLVLANEVKEKYRYFGKPGSVGGDGGSGGIGGFGGMAGKIMVLKLDESSSFLNTRNFRGSEGIGGGGGRGGRDGKKGNDIYAEWCIVYAAVTLWIPIKEWCNGRKISEVIYSTSRAASGSNGHLHNFSGRQEPENAKPFQNIADISNDYKIYLRENLMDRFKRRSLIQFVKQIDSNTNIKDSYDTLRLVNELQGLEKQVGSLHGLNKENIIYFYQSILNRTSEYAQHHENDQNFGQYRKVLRRLYTATLSKMYNLRVDLNPNLIINLDQNLDLVKEDIDNLRKLQEKANKAHVIDHYKKKYKSKINVKLREAESLIANQIVPEINSVNIMIGNEIDLLINETMILQEKNKEKKTELIQKKQELENMLIVSWIFSAVQFFGQAIGCFGKLGSAIDSVTESATEIGGSLALDGQTTTLKLPDGVVSNIRSIKNEIRNLKEQKALGFKKDATSIIDKSAKALQFGTVAVNIYSKYKDDKEKIETIDDAIEQATHQIQQLEQYEAEIYNTMIPILENMGNDLDHLASELNTKSQVALEVTKWQVQRVLRDIKVQMRQFTKGFNVEENLARSIENLEEVITTLINVYDHIQNYQYQKQLADYLANISSPKDNSIDVTDPKLGKAVNDLEVVIRSNLVLERYKIAVNALKQQTFPLVHLYLEEPMLPSHLEVEYNFQNLVDKAMKQIEAIRSKIKEYKTSITQHDHYMNSGWFNSDYESTKPFFVWKNEGHRDTIRKLLIGEKVVIKSNILSSPPDKDAIKFNLIGVNFYSSNSSISSELRNKLKRFQVSITHLGNSYYRFNNNIYIITSGSQNIQYSFEKDDHKEPIHKNNVYDKIKSGDSMLSPYAMWEIQLINLNNNAPFELEMYKDKVDLELVGHGCYLTKGWNISNLELEKYYKTDDMTAISYGDQLESPIGNAITQAQELYSI